MEKVVALRNSPLVALIDEEDWTRVADFKWRLDCHGYVVATVGKRNLLMHRVVMEVEDSGIFVDHKFGDRLDNRKSQLRVSTPKQNGQNKGKTKAKTTSQYKGVSWDKTKKKWLAFIGVEGKRKFIGRFDTAEKAAEAYNKKAAELYGEWSRPNAVVTVTIEWTVKETK